MPAKIHTITTLRTGITDDGELELQLIHSEGRGSTFWFRLNRAQALKLAREIEALQEATEAVWTPVMKPPIKLAE